MSEAKPPPDAPAEAAAEESNRRRHPRAPLSLLIQYKFDSYEEFVSEYSTDISMGGMFIRTEQPRPEGSMVYLQFTLRDGFTIIEALGRVVRVNPPNGDQPSGMGVEFVNFDPESRGVVADLVERRLRSLQVGADEG